MNYQIIETESMDGQLQKHVIIDNGNDTFVSFPVDESNSVFLAFIEANPEALNEVNN